MARVLTFKRNVVPQSERKRYIERLRLRRDYYTRAGCTFWVIEEMGLHRAFIEFTEAAYAAVLSAAHANGSEAVFDADRVYKEVEIR